jgi:hypothetical protein
VAAVVCPACGAELELRLPPSDSEERRREWEDAEAEALLREATHAEQKNAE